MRIDVAEGWFNPKGSSQLSTVKVLERRGLMEKRDGYMALTALGMSVAVELWEKEADRWGNKKDRTRGN